VWVGECVCVREREREREREKVCVRLCVRLCVCMFVRVLVCMCVYVRDKNEYEGATISRRPTLLGLFCKKTLFF